MAGEWITSATFRADMRRALDVHAREVLPLEVNVAGLLEGLLDRNAQKNIADESRRPLYEQRSQRDALAALDQLIRDAAAIATAEGRKSIGAADVTLAYGRKFCQFFPFC
jgi:hypothetical protein